jgi:hypothetical protein
LPHRLRRVKRPIHGVAYTPPSGKFTALFPTEPKADHQTFQVNSFALTVNNFIVTNNDMILGVTYTEGLRTRRHHLTLLNP